MGVSAFSVSFHLTQKARIPIEFYNQILWELLLLGLELWTGAPGMGLGSLIPSGEPLQPLSLSLSRCSTALYGYGTIPLGISGPPTKLDVAFPLSLQIYML